MSVRVTGVVAAMLCGVAAGPVAAQGLADVARKEAARREQIKTSGKVLTNADLPASAVVAPPSEGGAAAASPSEAPAEGADATPSAPAGGDAATSAPAPQTRESEAPKDDEQGWTRRAATVNGALREARAQVRQLQALVDRLGLEAAATDKNIAARAAAERAEARTQLAEARTKEAAAAATRAALEQEARASGVPPAWIQ